MALSREITLTIDNYNITLDKEIKIYEYDAINLCFTIQECGIVMRDGKAHNRVMPVVALKAYMLIETPQGTDSVEATNIVRNKIMFSLGNKYSRFIGTGKMQIILKDFDGCRITLPDFTYEVKQSINTGWDDGSFDVLITEKEDTIITDELGRPIETTKISEMDEINEVTPQTYTMVINEDGNKKIKLDTIMEPINEMIEVYDDEEIEVEFPSLHNDVERIKGEINSILFFPRLEGENNDYNRMLRALNNTSVGGTLEIPVGNYTIDKDLEITKAITIIGDGMGQTVITGGGIRLKANSITIKDLSINTTSPNAFYCNEGEYSAIRLIRCEGIAQSHSFLFESYYGTVSNVLCEDCVSKNSVHGFISKAYNITFSNCKAYNHTQGFGFGLISDNIIGTNNVGYCYYSKVLNCQATNCSSGVRSYCRDKHNSATSIRCNDNIVDGFISINSFPISIGEEVVPEGYLAINRIENMIITNVRDLNTPAEGSILLKNAYNCIIDNCRLQRGIYRSSLSLDNLYGNIVRDGIYPGTIVTPLNGMQYLDTCLNTVFEMAMTSEGTNSIKLVGEPKNGSIVTVLVRHAGYNTFGGFDTSNTIIDTTKFNIIKSYTFNHGQVTQWLYFRSVKKWLCIYASEDINLS